MKEKHIKLIIGIIVVLLLIFINIPFVKLEGYKITIIENVLSCHETGNNHVWICNENWFLFTNFLGLGIFVSLLYLIIGVGGGIRNEKKK